MMDKLPALAEFKNASEQERQDVTAFLLNTYGFDIGDRTLERAASTVSSRVYRGVDPEHGPFIVKMSSWFKPPEGEGMERIQKSLSAVYRMTDILRVRGLPLPRALPARDGEVVHIVDRQPTTVLTFEEGEPFDFSLEQCGKVGKAMGELHRAGMEYFSAHPEELESLKQTVLVELPYEESRRLYDENLKTDIREKPSSPLLDSVREALDDIESAIAYVDASGVNSHDRIQTFLHNDLNAGNVLFDEKGEVRALIDLDQASPGPAVWDIGNTLASFATQLYKENPSTDIEPYVHTFIRNYHAANPLPLKEYSLILAATQRWDLMRILRNIRRHLYEHNRHSALYSKTGARLIPRLRWAPKAVDFITDEWIEDAIK